MKKILILGCGGFIGHNLAIFFSKKKNFKVYGTYLSKKPKINNIKLYQHNILNKNKTEEIFRGKDIIINCAAVTSGAKDILARPYIHVTQNNIINSIVVEAAFKKKTKHLIMLSCTLMYNSSKKKLKETDLDLNKGLYSKYFGGAWMKIYMEKMTEFFSKISKTRFTIIRHSNLYGAFDKFDLKRSHVFGATINKVLNAKKEIIVLGKGNEKRDLLYIDDFTNFIDKVIKKQKKNFKLYNCGLGKFISIKDLTNKIIKISDKNLKIKFDKSFKSLNTYVKLNCQLAYKELGWKPRISLDEGIKRTIKWYKSFYKYE
jgi:GDP-L-fucose synthase